MPIQLAASPPAGSVVFERRGSRRASICAAVWAPPSVTICSSTRTRCSSSLERAAYCAAFSAALIASTSSFFSRNLKKRLNINISMTVGRPTMIVAKSTAVGPSITRSPWLGNASLQLFDFAREFRRLVGDDALDRFEPILDRPDLRPELRILIGQQLDALRRFTVGFWVNWLAPGTVERVTVLDPKPVVEQPSPGCDSGDDRDVRKYADNEGELLRIHP